MFDNPPDNSIEAEFQEIAARLDDLPEADALWLLAGYLGQRFSRNDCGMGHALFGLFTAEVGRVLGSATRH
jgi:hypothetical protein